MCLWHKDRDFSDFTIGEIPLYREHDIEDMKKRTYLCTANNDLESVLKLVRVQLRDVFGQICAVKAQQIVVYLFLMRIGCTR